MNDTILTQLKILVERAVRPVRASSDRTTGMRRELLAHVSAVFEEEATLGDERAALEQTRVRFGNPAELTVQLQASVPRSDAIVRFLGYLMHMRSGEPVIRRAARHALLLPLALGVQMLVLIGPVMMIRERWLPGPTLAVFFAALLGASSVLAFLFTLSANYLRGALFESPAPSWAKGMLCSACSALIIPAVTWGTCLAISGDAATSLADASGTLYLCPLIPFMLIGIAKPTADEIRFEKEWANLKIDGAKETLA